MMNFFKKPLVQFLLLGLMLFGIQQVAKKSNADRPIEITNQVMEHLKTELENEWQVNPDSLILNVAKDKWIEQELLYRVALENELDLQSDLVKNAMIQTAEDYILSEVGLREPTDLELSQFMKTASKVYWTASRISFRQYFFGGDIMFAQRSLFDSKEIDIEGSEAMDLSSVQLERLNRQIASDFGLAFSDSLIGKKTNWRGIVPSKFGIHVVIIDSLKEAKMAELNEIRNQVLVDFRRQKLMLFRDSMLLDMKNRTEIVETFE